ncbi:TonB family protein [Sphingomonas jinjuensis]|uniref:TonB family protein n=1 Tax=Sphingomonas jinjuensis TaxID=535907 RepID=A0A840FIC6_9SPHN|nr:energy transducer TonB [Sphingomonas jinjuensis]MBB4155447.1 TonB family protein [Sphingomonas jinjuensis]
MKPIVILLTAIAVLFPASSSAKQAGDDITVRANPVTPAQWSAAVARRLDRAMASVAAPIAGFHIDGIVTVRFAADRANRPKDLVVARPSGHSMLDRLALRAIARMGTMPEMPASIASGQHVRANLVFATDWESYDRMVEQLRREALFNSLAQRRGDTDTVLVVGTIAASGN